LFHQKIIITSNYSIEALFHKDTEMAAAIRRRFAVTEFKALKQTEHSDLSRELCVPDELNS